MALKKGVKFMAEQENVIVQTFTSYVEAF